MNKNNVAQAQVLDKEPLTNTTVADAARAYLKRGFAPVPVPFREKGPIIKGWQTLKVTDAEIDRYFPDPAGNIGLSLGAMSNGLIDVDLDCREACVVAPYLLPDTEMVHGRTNSRAAHYWYRTASPLQTKRFNDVGKTKDGEKAVIVEVRSSGAQTIVPPSVHPSGEVLAWERDGEPAVVDADELFEAVEHVAAAALVARHWPSMGNRQDAAMALAGMLLREDWLVEKVERFIEAVTVAANDDEWEKRVRVVAGTADKIARGELTTGGPKLADLLVDGKEVVARLRRLLFNPFEAQPNSGPQQRFNLTDLGNAERLVSLHGRDLRYVAGCGWFVWDGRRWRKDDIGQAYAYAKVTARTIWEEATAIEDVDARKLVRKWANQSESAARIASMLQLAQSPLPRRSSITITPEDLDTDPLLLNVNNGTIDLRTGTLLPFNRAQLISKLAPVDYDPNSVCPTWKSFLDLVFDNDQELIAFVQRACGYTLTGLVSEQALFFSYGTGQNGKSTFLNTLLKLLGDYAKPSAPDLLLVKRNDAHPTELADLCGVRLVITIEVEQGRQLAESLMKCLTGGDRLKARFMRQDFFEFEPTHKIWLAANHRPIVRGTDYAIWRRIHMIPFTVRISDKVPLDPSFPSKLAAEMPGILRWCVDGCLDYRQNGLQPPATIVEATKDYQEDMDTVGRFLAERCVLDKTYSVPATALYLTYTAWAEEQGEFAMSRRRVGDYLRGRGFETRRSGANGGYEWHGLSLSPWPR